MKNFLIKVFSVLLFTSIFVISVELLFREVPNNYSIKFSDFANSNFDDLEGVYFGSSHSLFGINPEYSNIKAFNLANTSQSIDLDKEIFDRKKENWKKLKVVFIEISYFSLGSRLSDGEEYWRDYIYDYYLREKPLVLLSRYPSPITSMKSIIGHFILGELGVKTNSYGHQFTQSKIKDNSSFELDAKVASSRHFNDLSVRNEDIYFEFIELLLTNKISVVVHVPPVSKAYKVVFNKDQRVLVESFLSELKNKFNEITVLDNSSLFENRYDFFYDSDHLNSLGAKKYTEFLNDYIK